MTGEQIASVFLHDTSMSNWEEERLSVSLLKAMLLGNTTLALLAN